MIYLKLGGSLITEKAQPFKPNLEAIRRIAGEIADARMKIDHLELLIGHGSGSFGHSAAAEHSTHEGVHSGEGWRGFIEVWRAARALNQIVMDILSESHLPVIAFPPSASAVCEDGEIASLSVEPIIGSIQAGLIPVVYGDVAFDRSMGGTIVSTERVFHFLLRHIPANLILLAGKREGVLLETEEGFELLPTIDKDNWEGLEFFETEGTDVTGGMLEKVRFGFSFLEIDPGVEVRIFSAEPEGAIFSALQGAKLGTEITVESGRR